MTEPVKVYELAKELGMDSISLLSKLKGLDIAVKSHMSELNSADVQRAKDALVPKSPEKKTAAKKKAAVVRKKAPVAAETTAAETPKATAAPAAVAPAVTEPTPPIEASTDPQKAGAAPVIRRRRTADMTEGTTVTTTTLIRKKKNSSSSAPESEAPESSDNAAPVTFDAAESATESTQVSHTAEHTMEVTSVTTSPAPGESSKEAVPEPVRRNLLKIVQPGGAVKSKIEIISHAKPADKAAATSTDPSKTAGRVFKMTKEALDQMAEEEARKKRGVKEEFVKPEDVNFADYRKKEMVFLPKKKKPPVGKDLQRTKITKRKASKRIVQMAAATITVQELAGQLNVRAPEIIKKLMGLGHMANIHAALDLDTATLIAQEYQYEVRDLTFKEDQVLELNTEDKAEDLQPRPPVVTIMGHVDHGKTSLLDSIREANVVASEAGGITQHIGAYTISKDGKLITFIDTPGHEAFSTMRARGANVTDIVILVVAADDGVMPQTREAVAHAKAAGVPIIVAVNKIDKPGANPEKIKQELSELELLPEEWGGQTMFVPVSALKKTNLDKLLEAILLNAEVLDLKANPNVLATGTVLESRLEKGRGPVATVLVKRGTLKISEPLVCGSHSGRVRAMVDHLGRSIESVGPGMAAEVIGLEGVPQAGDLFYAAKTEADARAISENRDREVKLALNVKKEKMRLEDLFSKMNQDGVKELRVVLKADVFGSVEAIKESLTKATTEKVKVNVIYSQTGGITESDVMLASASNAIIVGFNVRPETKARQIAEAEGIQVKCYAIIYELMDDIKKAMGGLLDKLRIEKFLGRAEVRQTFSVPKVGTIAGSAVIDGKIVRGANVRLLRDSRIIFEGKMHSLKRFKDDAREVAQGYECGIGLEGYNDLKPGDIIEAYEIEMQTQEL